MRRRTRVLLLSLAVIAALAGFILTEVKFTFTGRWEGIFLLKKRHGKLFEVKDDIYLGDGHRLIASIPFWWPKTYRSYKRLEKNAPCLYYEWDEKNGRGFVRNFLPGGKRISTSFSRFNYIGDIDELDDAIEMHGLYVGGGLPVQNKSEDTGVLNETGMAYWNGERWFHLWCTVNEGIVDAQTFEHIPPYRWKFLGSSVIKGSMDSLAITSAHELVLEGQPLRMDRFAYFRAGKTYFILSIWLKNEGDGPVSFYYNYGDEPWLGNFGSSMGNVGWVKDRLITTVKTVDTKKYSYAGFFDYGAGTSHNFTWAANFIEWFGDNTPKVFFTNSPDEDPDVTGEGEPLTGDSRFINVQWGPLTLQPGERTVFVMAIGMAANDPETGFPVKPEIRLKKVPRAN